MLLSLENWKNRLVLTFFRDLPRVLNSDIEQYALEHFRNLLGFDIMAMVATFHCFNLGVLNFVQKFEV